jgi:hypothetical protein
MNVFRLGLAPRTNPKDVYWIDVLETPRICISLPCATARDLKASFLQEVVLADPPSSGRGDISILIGLDTMNMFLRPAIISDPDSTLRAQESVFGLIVFGRTAAGAAGQESASCLLTAASPVSQSLESFWTLETMGIKPDEEDGLPDPVYEEFKKTTSFDGERYVVRLPWKQKNPPLQNNFLQARQRLSQLMRRLKRNPELAAVYQKTLEEYLKENVLEEVPPSEFSTDNITFYLPHHPVVREDKATTKIRPVFDGSAVTPSGLSLNDCLFTGPSLNCELLQILLRFRTGEVAVTADIRRAFLQVGLHQEDRDACRILWEVQGELKTYRFARVTFGLGSSPFLLGATIKFHAENQPPSRAVDAVLGSMYVDDFVHSEDSVDESVEVACGVKETLATAGMELCQFTSNSTSLIERLDAVGVSVKKSSDVESSKVLGLVWDRRCDRLSMAPVNPTADLTGITKRTALSLIARPFDPLGLATPFLTRSKLFAQEVWKSGIDWDDPLPPELEVSLSVALADQVKASEVAVPRRAVRCVSTASVHVFSDASPSAYACAVYVVDSHGSQLLVAKAKVAPLRVISLPRLELLGCLIGARLVSTVRRSIPSLADAPLHGWTDATIVLDWLFNPPPKDVFVRNRIAEIWCLLPNVTWHHVRGLDNPADLGTRLDSSARLAEGDLWLHGPEWLRDPESWPLPWKVAQDSHITLQVTDSGLMEDDDLLLAARQSSLNRFIRKVAILLRFMDAVRRRPVTHLPSTVVKEEMDRALTVAIRRAQYEAYSEEVDALQRGSTVLESSNLSPLRPSLDEDGCLRFVGRAEVCPQAIGLLVLPPDHPLTKLIVKDQHETGGHFRTDITLSLLRERYWIPRGRQVVRRVLARCTRCRAFDRRPYTIPEAPLPAERFTASRPFERIGVDLFGPIPVKDDGKVFGMILTCMTTRAISLELLKDITTESILNGLRRLEARYGRTQLIISDNAKQFRKAAGSLRKRVQWHFIPERSPHFGGFYERLIGSVKSSLRKVMGRTLLTSDELLTLLVEIAGILNRRPLTYQSGDPHDLPPLRPIDLICPSVAGPSPSDATTLTLYRSRLAAAIDFFWKIWHSTYLASLQRWRNSFATPSVTPSVGDVVQLQVPGVKNRMFLPLGRITGLFPGRDGKARVAMVKTGRGTLRRSVRHLYPLELSPAQLEEPRVPPPSSKEHVEVQFEEPLVPPPSFEELGETSLSDQPLVVTRSGRNVKKPLRMNL